nr:hypothetical protein Iba_chr03aCG21240 [Ipomoea batatas]
MDAVTGRSEDEEHMERGFRESLSYLRSHHAATMAAVGIKKEQAIPKAGPGNANGDIGAPIEIDGEIETKEKDDDQIDNVEAEKELPSNPKGVSFAKEATVIMRGDPSTSKIAEKTTDQVGGSSAGGKVNLTQSQPVCENAPKGKTGGMSGQTPRGVGTGYAKTGNGDGQAWSQRNAGIPVGINNFDGIADWDEGEKEKEDKNEGEKSEDEQGGRVEVMEKEGEGETEGENEESDEESEDDGDSDHDTEPEVSKGVSEGSGTDQLAKIAEIEIEKDKTLEQMNLSPRKPPDIPKDKPPDKARKKAVNVADKPMRVTRSKMIAALRGCSVGDDCFEGVRRWFGGYGVLEGAVGLGLDGALQKHSYRSTAELAD